MAVAIHNRSVRREAVLPKSSSPETSKSKVDPDDAIRKTYSIYSSCTSVLTWHLDPLHDLFRILPKSEQAFRSIIRAANLEKGIKATEFQVKKERILILYHLLENVKGLTRSQIRTLADAVLLRRDKQVALGILKDGKKEEKGGTGSYLNVVKGLYKSTISMGTRSSLTREEALWREANNFATSMSDSRFLSHNTSPVDECLRDATVEAEETAYTHLRKQIESLVDGIGQQFFTIQEAECDRQILREITSAEDKELGSLRSEFVRQIEDISRERSRSYVHHSLGNGP